MDKRWGLMEEAIRKWIGQFFGIEEEMFRMKIG